MEKILIIKSSALGDIVQAYPVIDYLHRKFPAAQLDWVVERPFMELVQNHPYITNVWTIATKAWRKQLFQRDTWSSICDFRKHLRQQKYDAAFDLQGNIKSALVLSQVKSPNKVGFSWTSVPEWPNCLFTNRRITPDSSGNIRHDYLSLVAGFFGETPHIESSALKLKITTEKQAVLSALLSTPCLQGRPLVMVCPGAAWSNKQLPLETLKKFLTLIHRDLACAFLFIWGSPEEKNFSSQLHDHFRESSLLVDKMSLSMLQNLMGECYSIIAMDSLPLHLAGTTNTPTFSVFGPSLAAKYKPLGEQHHAVQGPCPYQRSFDKRCPILRSCPTGACIRDLKSEALFDTWKARMKG